MRARPVFALVVLSLVVAACSSSSKASPLRTTTTTTRLTAASGVVLTTVAPSATDPRIGAPDAPNIAAVDSSVPANGELLVFLPGTGGSPRCCQLLLKVAATMGFAAIGLAYPNATSVDSRCRNDLSCFGAVRQNEFDGASPGPASSVAPDNAIESRLTAMLSYLARTEPHGPWSKFLQHGGVNWARTVIAGHSQGGGEAAYIGKVERTEGVVMLSSVVDSTNTTPPEPAPYLTSGHRTPLDRYVGFDHAADPLFTKITTDWSALGLGTFGPLTSVDDRSAPYGHSHQLTTLVAVPHLIILPEHDSTAVDIETPTLTDGTPRFAPVWRYLLNVAGGLARPHA